MIPRAGLIDGIFRRAACRLLFMAAAGATVLVLALPGDADARRRRRDDAEAAGKSDEKPDASEPARPPAVLTYIDTLNAGRELAVSEKEVTPAAAQIFEPVAAPAATVPAAAQTDRGAPAAEVYRIQVLASSQIDMIRSEKRNLESRTTQPVYITFSAPFYKLLVGDFTDRAAAEKHCTELKNQGYGDAWIVRGQPGKGM